MIGCNNITDIGMKHIKNLEVLFLIRNNKITNDGLKHLKNIHSLSINNCKLINDKLFNSSSKLKYLTITGNNFNNIGHLTNLETLHIYNN